MKKKSRKRSREIKTIGLDESGRQSVRLCMLLKQHGTLGKEPILLDYYDNRAIKCIDFDLIKFYMFLAKLSQYLTKS